MPAEPTSAQLRRQARKEADSQPFEKISCAECRRLKIKCSKEIPCQSCIRRGCRSICPQGSLATEHLHRRIAKMNTRIRELEDALADVHRAHSDEPHPLLREDIISRPTVEEPPPDEMQTADIEKPPNDTIDAFGTLSISEQGVSRFFGSTAGSELSLDPADEDSPANTPSPPSAHAETASSSTVAFFSRSFPFTPLGSSQEAQTLIESYLPTWDRAQHLCRLYFSDVFWLIKTVVPSQVYEDMLPVIYRRQDAIPGEEYDTPHNLSLLFIILALGSLVEATADLPDGLHNLQEAEHYHQISKAALPLQPILERTIHICRFKLYILWNNMELTWNLTTLAAHVAQTVSNRDSARWGLSEKMVQRRRVIFWDLFVAENWNCLSTGRPPSFKLSYIDCKLPESGDAMPYESWALRFAQDCVAETASQACASQTPSYEAIMELDKKVRDYPLPNMSTSSMPESVVHTKVLLFIHRSFFAQAIVDEPSNPLKSVYAPSFLAAYRASSQILRVVKDQFQTAPTMTSRWWMTWSFAFSAALVFGMVVTKGPSSPLANSAMKELDEACILFSKVAPMNRRASKALVILSRLNAKARAALASAKDGSDSGAGWGSVDDYDDLSIFAGHTRLVSNKQRIPELSAGRYPRLSWVGAELDQHRFSTRRTSARSRTTNTL
ncbi:hypothetical protein DL96DRAFT_1668442 [Flagelloscypha sp. PMI_526]|nr:hypothetical protein DL96DRAFT_1668442 [Flagelloscypha sp. PMI_526]